MAADEGVLDQLKAYFFANDPNLTANLKLRERIALAQMARRSAYPKTFGEGLSAIGEALGERRLMGQLEAADAAGMKEASGYKGPESSAPAAAAPPPVRRSYAPDDANTVAPVEREPPRVVTPALLPAVPLPPDQQQSDEPGAPIRMPSPDAVQDWRNANPLPPSIPPLPTTRAVAPPPPQLPPSGRIGDQPAGGPVNRLMTPPGPLPPGNIPAPTLNERLAPAFPGQQSSMQPPPGTPVMAAGNEASAEEMAVARDRLAQAMIAQQAARGGPQPLPTTRAATTPPPPDGGPPANPAAIRAAPPSGPAPIQAMPEQPGAVAGWVPAPANTQPRAAPVIAPSRREAELTRALNMAIQRNPHMAASPAAFELQQLQADRAARQKDVDKLFEAQIARDTEQQKLHITGRMDQTKRISDEQTAHLEREQKRLAIEDAREKSILQSRFGGRDPEKVFAEFDTARESARGATHALTQFAVAKKLIDDGVIVGTGQGWKVSLAKVAGALGSKDAAQAVSRTEEMQAAIKSTLRIAVENIQGAGGKVSDTDVAIASGTIGADPTLQLQTIKNLVERGEAAARQKLDGYNDQVTRYLGGTRAEPRYRVKIPGSEAATEPPPVSTPAPAAGQTPEAVAADGTILVVRNGKWVPK